MDRNQLVAAQSTFWFPLAPLQLLSKSDRMVVIGVYPLDIRDLATFDVLKYENADWWRVARTGGVTHAIIENSGYGRGNGGVSLPCKGCWVQRRPSSDDAWIDCSDMSGVGPYIPGPDEGCQPIWIPISDVGKLYIGGSAGDVVDIVYLLG
jgi:hypothetical protein